MSQPAADVHAPITPRIRNPVPVAMIQLEAAATMKSSIVKRSIELNGHKTSVSLEDEFWAGLRSIAETGRVPLPELLQTIDAKRGQANLSSAIRVYVLVHYREIAAAQAAAKTLDQSPEPTPAMTPAGSAALPTKGEA